jgi:hypothetical protein
MLEGKSNTLLSKLKYRNRDDDDVALCDGTVCSVVRKY